MAKYFINESLDYSDKQLIVLTNGKASSKSIEGILNATKKMKIKTRVINISSCMLELEGDSLGIIDDDSKNPLKIDPYTTVILCRRGVVKNTYTQDIARQLEDAGYYVVNKLSAILDCENKYLTLKKLESAGIPVPRSVLVHNIEHIEKGLEKIGGKFPIIMKLLSGTQGIGVSIIESLTSLNSVLQTMWSLDDSIEILLQEKIEADYDLRIHVLNRGFQPQKEETQDAFVVAAMKRTKADKDFRTNYSIGGGIESIELTDEQIEIAINATKILNCRWGGVDIMVDKKTGNNYVLEVNSSPGTEGITKASGVPVIQEVLKFIMNRNNWIRTRTEVGFLEKINIPGIGDFVGRFDTGNGSKSCSVHADTIKVDEDKEKVYWTIGDRKFVNDLKGFTTSITGKVTDRRPLIELTVNFLGKDYIKVLVSPVLRDNKSAPFLINRSFMDKAQVVINPQKVFLVSQFPEYDIKTKGNHNGIKLEKK